MKLLFVASLTVCLLFGANLAIATRDTVATPEERGAAFIDALNPESGTDWETYITENFSAEFVERRGIDGLIRIMAMISDDVGRVRIESVEKQDDNTLRLVVYSETADHWLAFGLGFDPLPGHLISSFEALFIPAPLARDKVGLADEGLAEEIAAYIHDKAETDQFSGAVIVAHNGKAIFAEAFGDADKKTRRKNTLDTPVNLGSMNKMFTALAIAQLVDEGLLDYADTVGQHLPDYPNPVVRNEVTIHQLLSHTSGLGSYWGKKFDSKKNDLTTVADFVALFAEDPLEQPPGKGFLYSNNGPTVAGLIIEKVSGLSYYDYIRQNIYLRARMTRSDHYRKDDNGAGFAIGYEKTESGEWQDNIDWLGMIGGPAGGGYASANDLLRYSSALSGGDIVSAAQVETVTSGKIRLAEDFAYGYGFGEHELAGQRYVGHNGGAPGTNAEFSLFPELGYTVIVLANYGHAATPVADYLRQLIAHSK
ncbi:MAG: serine hydrolase [Gammaproteobacteria bacterium]|nr:serine hydrolase [Gammaproteobacteria bacterium]